jgi:hypothetical protein
MLFEKLCNFLKSLIPAILIIVIIICAEYILYFYVADDLCKMTEINSKENLFKDY